MQVHSLDILQKWHAIEIHAFQALRREWPNLRRSVDNSKRGRLGLLLDLAMMNMVFKDVALEEWCSYKLDKSANLRRDIFAVTAE